MKNINAETLHFIKCNFNQVQHKLLNKYSPAETKFIHLLRSAGIYYRRERGKYKRGQEWCYYDFYLPYYRIYVEIDGIDHLQPSKQLKDKLKERYVSNNQSFIARFTNSEVMNLDILTIDNIIDKVTDWMSSRRKRKTPKPILRDKYLKLMNTHLKQIEKDIINNGLVPIDCTQKVYLYDHYNGEFYEFSNIIEAKQSVKEFTITELYALIYNYEYKKSNNRRFVFGKTYAECESKVAKVYF